ncbi:alpha-galactosidase/alpha-n-acetylgalactosaminidase [Desarmillaria tabescens]|uniref:Alpha-galactosidase n=1 Tax=Armillaria tabescens TaxID=1929756 RepID=A0AA39NAD7_ARMTA|nr:alpha-galactosidase/alpha-n-acetylgalactosaminidase [Desarmillaria tabescens]KAK0461995.1 alpha-galactosidase/alpha-n-acetylgalactosaminidase [Desarmillaria tabescens]
MGWNTYRSNFNESIIKEVADLFVSLGLRDAGYEYITLDGGWSALNRTDRGQRQPNPESFPNGIKPLVDYVHSKGLKVGIYSDAGLLDCGFAPGSYGYEDEDIATFAEWGIDFLKYDNCGGFHANVEPPQVRFGRMRDAISRSNRGMLYSMCQWGSQFPWFWADAVGHTYRMAGDINAYFGDEAGHKDCQCASTAYCLNTGYAGCSVLAYIRKMRETLAKTRTHFGFWAALKPPLVLGTDLSRLSSDKLDIVKNKDVIAVNQDALGKAAAYIKAASQENVRQVWSGPLANGDAVVLIFNETPTPQNISVDVSLIDELSIGDRLAIKDLWTGETWSSSGIISADDVDAWDTRIFRVAISVS